MKQIQKIITILILVISSFNLIYASTWDTVVDNKDDTSFLWIKKSSSARILDNFKDRQQVLLFENVPISSEDEEMIFDSDSKLAELEKQLKMVEDRKKVLKERKRNVTKQKFDLKTALKELDDSIAQTESDIKDKEDEILSKNLEISELTSKISDVNAKIDANKKTILNYLSYIYTKWEWMYSEDNEIDVVKSIVLNDWDIAEMLSDIHYKTLLELSWQSLIEQHRDLLKEYYYNKQDLKKSKLDSIRLKNELNARVLELWEQKSYKEELLEETKWQEALYNKFISQKLERANEIKDKIGNLENSYSDVFNNIWNKYNCDLKFMTGGTINSNETSENTTSESAKCEQVKKYFELEKKLRDDDSSPMDLDNPLAWPSEPERWLSTYYHDEWYFAALWSEHEAIDIRYYQWTDLKAPASWYVYFISPPAPWKYSYIALKHANWFVTVYWHVSEILVNQFDYIQKWQVFAKSWWAPWTPWAWWMTSWPHLHFEVYKDRQNVDPLRYMDVTYLDFDKLPLNYKYKYIEDMKIKYWNKKINMDKYQKFYIAWESEIDRQKYLLNKYASNDFNNWNIWAEEAIAWQIDPSFLMCVWLAETWLWKHLKTWYNVWNIWNTDSWWTYSFESPREWILWMVKTLNNRYLSKYRSIDMLSRWWNKTWSIYASSSKNWHNNVVKCLSSLKWRFIEDDYKFRLYESD